jgi:hypothetical protein
MDISKPCLKLLLHNSAAVIALYEQDKLALKTATGIAI